MEELTVSKASCLDLLDKLNETHFLTAEEYGTLVINADRELADRAAQMARNASSSVYGNKVFIRGLIEFSNCCHNNCFYCGLRRSNVTVFRYRLDPEKIYEICSRGYDLGFRTFVLQGGEDLYYDDARLCRIVSGIKKKFPDCAVTLSVGERSEESYRALKEAGADRYLLRQETADAEHYGKIHPAQMSFENRMACLENLKKLGFETGAGFMVGTPYETVECLAKNLFFIQQFKPHMCGIGPFIPHRKTPFADAPAGFVSHVLFSMSLVRIACPDILLPATTALSTLDKHGIENGILAGANVIMPNLTPAFERGKYELYDNKVKDGIHGFEKLEELKALVKFIGYEIVCARGSHPDFSRMEEM